MEDPNLTEQSGFRPLEMSEVEGVSGGRIHQPGPIDDPYHFARKGSAGGAAGSPPDPYADVIDPALLEQETAGPPSDPDAPNDGGSDNPIGLF